jgi:wyosine [tRNA(Phe)-imidazoG37] synthetase (radical SAM superfamily)
VTLVGSGETTLHTGIGWLLQHIKSLTNIPVAVITNGSLLHLAEVREELSIADAVLASLDAGSPRLYRLINRPWSGLTYDLLLQGLTAFRREYRGQLWIEVMLMKGINDSEEALKEIADALGPIRPDQIHISVPSRPPAEPNVQRPDEEDLRRAEVILGNRALLVSAPEGAFDLSGYEDVTRAILAIITRHPMREDELRHALERWSPGQVEEALRQLSASGEAQVVERCGERFWSAAACRYPSLHSR